MPEFSVAYVISQIFATLGLGMQAFSYFISTRGRQLISVIVGNLCVAICFIILGAYIAASMNFIAIVRDSVDYAVEKHRAPDERNRITQTDKWLLALWITVLTAAAILTANGPLSLLPYCSSMTFTIAVWQKNILFYRIAGLVTNTLMIIYNAHLGNMMGFLMQMVLLACVITGLWKYVKQHRMDKSMVVC